MRKWGVAKTCFTRQRNLEEPKAGFAWRAGLTDRKTWCHMRTRSNSDWVDPEPLPPTWANHALLSCSTHAYIWSQPGQDGYYPLQTDRQIETAEQELQTNKTVFQGTVRVNWSRGGAGQRGVLNEIKANLTFLALSRVDSAQQPTHSSSV